MQLLLLTVYLNDSPILHCLNERSIILHNNILIKEKGICKIYVWANITNQF